MKPLYTIKARNIVAALLFVFVAHIALASFTGSVDEKSNGKYSLKNFNKTFYKKASPYSLTAGFQYKGLQVMSQKKDINGTTYTSVMRYEKGNTTYIYPYKHKVSVPLFKTPSAPAFR